MSLPWIPAQHITDTYRRWWDGEDVAAPQVWQKWYEASTGLLHDVLLKGWYDGVAVRPLTLRGWTPDGSTIQPFKTG